MKPLKIIPLLIALAAMLMSTSVLAAGKHALLIAIQDYSKTPFNSLSGPINDLKLTE
ncbi:secreted protein, partial [Candidatus Thiomargarita nelsonii]